MTNPMTASNDPLRDDEDPYAMNVRSLYRHSQAVFLACEEPVARDISNALMWAATEIERLSLPPRPDARDVVIEECAKIVEPKGPRPCDCERCNCHNQGDAEAVATWDSDNANAKTIRALARPADRYDEAVAAIDLALKSGATKL